jgi:hypothetical protein
MYGQVDATNTAMLREGLSRQEVQEIAMQKAKAALPREPAPDDLAKIGVVVIETEPRPVVPAGASVTLLPAAQEGETWVKRYRVGLPTAFDLQDAKAAAQQRLTEIVAWRDRMNAIDARAVEGEIAAAADLTEVQAILQRYEAL